MRSKPIDRAPARFIQPLGALDHEPPAQRPGFDALPADAFELKADRLPAAATRRADPPRADQRVPAGQRPGRPPRPDLGRYTFNVMAPLVIGDPHDLDSPASREAWQRFDQMLVDAKAHGAEAVSTDVWWGLIEPKDNQFRWDYYDRLADSIERAGLCWMPILSFHQCGGNVGDDATVPLPAFLGQKYARLSPADGPDGAFFRSEQGNVSREAISVWASQAALNEFEDVMRAFQRHFADRAHNIYEINISLGPSGELRYPSYNSHDRGAGYPTRGALQAYSDLALRSFRESVLAKYSGLAGVNRAWGLQLKDERELRPPSNPEDFFRLGHDKQLQYGRDFFDWYNASLLEHGRRLISTAVRIFDAPDAPFAGIDIGAKIPGIHWRVASDRAAELSAGLIRASRALDDAKAASVGRGYEDIVALFREMSELPNAPKIILHFTCLEMEDGQGGPEVASKAASLVRWVAAAAKKYGVPIKGENALTISDLHAWKNIERAIERDGYQGLTVLRLPLTPREQAELARLSATYR